MGPRWPATWLVTWLAIWLAIAAGGCDDVRHYAGTWEGPRIGDHPALQVGFPPSTGASLVIEHVDLRSLSARLSTGDGRFVAAPVAPIAGAEADVLAGMSFDGAPLRVFMAFVEAADGGGPALAVVALMPENRVEIRILRGGDVPLYGIFELVQAPD